MVQDIAVVTSASCGVGKAIAIGQARDGYDVVLVARFKQVLEKTKKRTEKEENEQRVGTFAVDLSDSTRIEALGERIREELGRVDALVNNAFCYIGENRGNTLLDVSTTELQEFSKSSIMRTWLVTRESAPIIQETDGRLVIIIADWGFLQHNDFLGPNPDSDYQLESEAFVSAKHAISGFAKPVERTLVVQTMAIFSEIIASLNPNLSKREPSHFDIDTPIEEIKKVDMYSDGWAIPFSDVAKSVVFGLNTQYSKSNFTKTTHTQGD